MPGPSAIAASLGLALVLAGSPLSASSERATPDDLGARCDPIVEAGEAFLRGGPVADASAASTLARVRDGLGFCRDPRVAAQTRVRLLLIASTIGETNHHETARVLLEEAHEIVLSEAPRAREHVLVLEALSGNAFGRAEYAAARQYMEEALRLRAELWGASSPEAIDGQIALVFYELAEASAFQAGDFGVALAKAKAALETSQRLFGQDASVTTRAWAAYAAVIRALGQVDKAEELLEQHALPGLEHLDEPLGEVPPPARP